MNSSHVRINGQRVRYFPDHSQKFQILPRVILMLPRRCRRAAQILILLILWWAGRGNMGPLKQLPAALLLLAFSSCMLNITDSPAGFEAPRSQFKLGDSAFTRLDSIIK